MGKGHHAGAARYTAQYECEDCGSVFTELYHEEYWTYILQCWDSGDGETCVCGGPWCPHEDRGENWYYYEADENGWTDNGNGMHTGMAIQYDGYSCNDCGQYIGLSTHAICANIPSCMIMIRRPASAGSAMLCPTAATITMRRPTRPKTR